MQVSRRVVPKVCALGCGPTRCDIIRYNPGITRKGMHAQASQTPFTVRYGDMTSGEFRISKKLARYQAASNCFHFKIVLRSANSNAHDSIWGHK